MIILKNNLYEKKDEFTNSLESLSKSNSWFSYLCATNEGISEIGLVEKIYFVVGGWLNLVENKTSEENIDKLFCEILNKNAELVEAEQFPCIYKIAIRANLIKNKSENNIQLVANEIYGIADTIQSIQEKVAQRSLSDQTIKIIPNPLVQEELPEDLEELSEDLYDKDQTIITISENEETTETIDSPSSNQPEVANEWHPRVKTLLKLAVVVGGIFLTGKFLSEFNQSTDSFHKTQPMLDTKPQFPSYKTFSVLQTPASLNERFSKFSDITNKEFVIDPGIVASESFFLDQKSGDVKKVVEESLGLNDVEMSEEGWMSEKELNENFASLQQLPASAIEKVYSDLARSYVENRNNKDGYYLLWLIKQETGFPYEIPKKDLFNSDVTVTEVLYGFFRDSDLTSFTNAPRFVEIFFQKLPFGKSFYKQFLPTRSQSIFLNFAVDQLQNVPMDKWPSKVDIITKLLETLPFKNRVIIAKALASSKDPATSTLGNHLSAALTANSLRQVIPHFYALSKFPDFDYKSLFAYPFVEFLHDKSSFNNGGAEFTKQLKFNDREEVFVHGSLMIGVHNTLLRDKKIPPYLLAYDMNTEKMVWGIPLTPMHLENPHLTPSETFELLKKGSSKYILKKVGEHLALQFIGEKKLYLIHPETGQFDSILELAQASENTEEDYDEYDEDLQFHMSAEGFIYQIVENDEDRMLVGGKMVNNQWNSSFKSNAPNGFFHPFSTHCGFQQVRTDDLLLMRTDDLLLIGPTGDQVTIQNYITGEAQKDKLYSIERDPVHKDKCLLTTRTLKTNNEVVSDVEISIPLNMKQATFGKICQNGQLVLFSDESLIFVDLNNQKVTYSPHKIPSLSEHIITDSGEVWTWDQLSKEIWKMTSENSTLMGSMHSGLGTALLHVDKNDHLYFSDI